MEGNWIPNELHRRCTSRLLSVILTQGPIVTRGMEFFGVRPIGGALFGDHRHVSIMGVVVWLLPLVAIGVSCFRLYVVWLVLSLSPFCYVTLGF